MQLQVEIITNQITHAFVDGINSLHTRSYYEIALPDPV